MNKRIIGILLSISIVICNGVLVYAKAPLNAMESEEKFGCDKDFAAQSLNDTLLGEEGATYEIPYYSMDDFAIGLGQTCQLSGPEVLVYYYYEPTTMQWVGEQVIPSTNYISSDPAVVSIDANGIVSGNAVGTATIAVEYYYYRNDILLGTATSYATVDVTDASLSEEAVIINIHGLEISEEDDAYFTGEYIGVIGASANSNIEVVSSSKNLLVSPSGDGYYLCPKKKGDYTLTVSVDGKVLQCNIKVVNMWFSFNRKSVSDLGTREWRSRITEAALYPGETLKLTAKGIPEGEKVTWASSNKSVAKVSQDGTVTGKGLGYATISATCQGYTMTYEIGVTYKLSIKALRYAAKHYNSTYSQPYRMKKDYYDCSSYVWRSYKDAGFDIGKGRTYAPVAADLAKWCVLNNYMVYSGTVDVSKLLPGDLIFWTGADNGRYEGIYHVDLYAGNNIAITVASQKWFNGTISGCMVARPNAGTKVASVKATKAKVEGKKAIRLSWKECYGATGYRIYRSSSKNGKFTKVATVKNLTSYNDTAAKSGITYYYMVRPFWKADSKTYMGKNSEIVSKKF